MLQETRTLQPAQAAQPALPNRALRLYGPLHDALLPLSHVQASYTRGAQTPHTCVNYSGSVSTTYTLYTTAANRPTPVRQRPDKHRSWGHARRARTPYHL